MAVVLQSRLLSQRGVRHAFSTREGGVSEGPFATLNTAVGPGDQPESVAENLRRFSATMGVETIRQTSQVHGSVVRHVQSGDDPKALIHEHADALATRDMGLAIGVRTADCVPILVHDAETGAVAAIHAGWRGVACGIVPNAIGHLSHLAKGTDLVAAIGPCISVDAFEVGEEVVDAFESVLPVPEVIRRDLGAKPHIDLRLAVRAQLRSVGIADARIEDVPGCTFKDRTRFFSHRRDGARSGRLLAAIVCPGKAS